jgi:hypothetical protein
MRKLVFILPVLVCAVAVLSQAAQPPREKPREDAAKDKPKDYSDSPIITRMMAFNKKKDGKLTRDEVTDVRLHRLFDQADTNKDGVVTKEELMALAAKLEGDGGQGGPGGRGPGGRGPGGDGGPGGRGPGGDGGPGGRGPGGFGGPPQPGQLLSPRVQERLNLTADQKKQLEALQKEIDGKLGKILTAEQKKQLAEMREGPGRGPGGRGPGGPGGPGGRGPDGGPGGRPRPEEERRPE